MPYIGRKARGALDDGARAALGPGELNYQLTKVCVEYVKTYDMSYSAVNTVVGALECCKLELYRRVAAPYEDKKIAENGDVYPEELFI